MMTPQLYPVGKQDFPKIIRGGFVYVDKTKYALELARMGGSYFLSKPRRFGKSLFISTLETIFKGEKELFKGMYIYDKWDFEEHPIIRLSFSMMAYEDNRLEQAVVKSLNVIASSYGLELVSDVLKEKFDELIKALHEKYNREVVILIDEYDKPLIDFLNKDNLQQATTNRDILKAFYSILKDAEPHIKLLLITGVSKFSKVSIFSDLNNLTDLSVSKVFNEICGISQKELEAYFPQELEMYDKEKIKLWYNGYKWDINGQTIYNPYSILSFFYDRGNFKNYWYTTGTPTFLMKMCREHHMYEFEEVSIHQDDLGNFDIENLKIVPVLFQTGYLTIVKEDIFNTYVLGFPNMEVRESYLRHLLETYIDSPMSPSSRILTDIKTGLVNKDQNLLKSSINSAFTHIPYSLWQKENEQYYHAIVHLLFSLMGVYIFSEVQTHKGRSDAIVIYEDQIYCMEFKLNQSAQSAIEQIVAKGYTERFKDSGKQIHHIGINFNSDNREVEEVVWIGL
jgi:hypothetical protein